MPSWLLRLLHVTPALALGLLAAAPAEAATARKHTKAPATTTVQVPAAATTGVYVPKLQDDRPDLGGVILAFAARPRQTPRA